MIKRFFEVFIRFFAGLKPKIRAVFKKKKDKVEIYPLW